MITCLTVRLLQRRLHDIRSKVNHKIVIPLGGHVRHWYLHTVGIRARDIHTRVKRHGFAVQRIEPRVTCRVVLEFHRVASVVAPIHTAKFYLGVRCPHVIVVGVDVLLIHVRTVAGERGCAVQVREFHLCTSFACKKSGISPILSDCFTLLFYFSGRRFSHGRCPVRVRCLGHTCRRTSSSSSSSSSRNLDGITSRSGVRPRSAVRVNVGG